MPLISQCPELRDVFCDQFYTDAEEQFPLNQVLEVVGIVCLDPTLPAVQLLDEEEGDGSALQDTRGPACKQPPSLVPR